MRLEDMSPHLRFLNDAAHLLAHSAPETSAFLMSRRNEVLVENDIPISDAQRQHACGACGHIMIPGQGDAIKIKTDKVKFKKPLRSQKTSAKSQPAPSVQRRATPKGISKILSCGKCFNNTILKVEGPSRISRVQKIAPPGNSSKDKRPQAASDPTKSANASSKKRAKNRKAGLQALLDQKQGSASSSGLGLSLSDFMKK